MRVVTVCDSDSYLKWAVALLSGAPDDWQVRHCVVDNVLAPSPAQIDAAQIDAAQIDAAQIDAAQIDAAQIDAAQIDVAQIDVARGAGAVETHTALGLARLVRRERPDALLLACTGPALEAVLEVLAACGTLGAPTRPVLVSGLPGISFPANDLAIHHRRHCDLFVLHSRREVAAYAEVVSRLGGPEIGLATLPFVDSSVKRTQGREVVFAAQALVPRDVADRRRVLEALEALPAGFEPVVKVRALAGERQAHNETHPYADLYAAMPTHAREIAFRAGSMADALANAAGFVTVSSTAAVEAIAAGVPALVLGDFGVDAETITLVFADSGLVGDLDDLAHARFRTPEPAWLEENYFHPEAANDWQLRLIDLVARRAELPPVRFRPSGSPIVRARRLARLAPQGLRSIARSAARRIRPVR